MSDIATKKEAPKTKTLICVSVVILILIGLAIGGAYWYHTKTMNAALAEQQELLEQKELLDKRVADIAEQLNLSEEERQALLDEKQSLLDKIDEMIAEDVYYFDAVMIEEEIKKIGELATIEYCYTNVGTLDATKELKLFDWNTGLSLPWTRKKVIMTMDGVIKIGMDVDGIKINSNETSKTITITLPKIRLLSNELDEDSIYVYNEEDALFNRVTMEDSSQLRTQIKAKSEERAKASGAYEQARDNAETILRCLLTAVPGLTDNYSIVFK